MQFSPTHMRAPGGAHGRTGRSVIVWAVRRALLAFAILALSIAAFVALLYASIDPEEGARASMPAATGIQVQPQRHHGQD